MDTETARQNKLGSPCPAWCQTDHADATAHFSAKMSADRYEPGKPYVKVMRPGTQNGAESFVSIQSISGYLNADALDAPHLAGLLEDLAGRTPEELSDLAHQVRLAAQVIREEGAV